jgi:hypothetical protein
MPRRLYRMTGSLTLCWSVVRNLPTPLSRISSLTDLDRLLEFMGSLSRLLLRRSLGRCNCGRTKGTFV